jgi:ADP-ribose pyrophosphatase YjhB (NUDIX family)
MKFPLINKYNGISGEDYLFEYYEADSINHIPKELLAQVQIMAFHKDKLLIVNNANKFDMYGPVGGGIEKGESPEECLPRELQEESNMRVIGEPRLIGYQKCTNLSNPEKPDEYQLRYFANVEPIGEFTPDCDPDGDVTELLEIDPEDYKKYFDWGETGDAIMNRALEFLKVLK